MLCTKISFMSLSLVFMLLLYLPFNEHVSQLFWNRLICHYFSSYKFIQSRQAEAVVKIDCGTVVGNVYASHRAFLGIPFAEAPTGELRWKAPVMLKRFNKSIFQATSYGASCIQHLMNTTTARKFLVGEGACESEDCLNVNVYTPRTARINNALPVIVFIYGGKFSSGSNSQAAYNPARLFLRKEKFIFVIPNYRVGPLGFLASKEMLAQSKDSPEEVGNFGILDIVLALDWVHANIAAFGGDPNNISIQGQSAGAMALLFVYKALVKEEKFFVRNLLFNSTSDPKYVLRNLQDGITQESFDAIAHAAGCNNCETEAALMHCMRQISVGKLKKIVEERHLDCTWSAFEHANIFTASSMNDFTSGIPQEKKANVFITLMKDDASIFVYRVRATDFLTSVQSLSILYHDYKIASKILSAYPFNNYSSHFHCLSQAVTDHVFRCPSIRLYWLLKEQNYNVYFQEIDLQMSILSMLSKWTIHNELGAFHGAELLAFFFTRPFLLTAKEREKAKEFQERIIKFCLTGSPKLADHEEFVPKTWEKCKFWEKEQLPFPRKSFANLNI
jgi:carboxylesterase type B